MKILLLDIETSPNLAFVWGLWQQDVRLDAIVDSSSTLCWAAKWLGEKEIMFDSVYHSSEKHMLRGIHKLLDQADVVVHYNGKKFDVPTLNKEFLLNGMSPPAPYKQVDMLQVSRGNFRFQSNKLDYVAQQLGLGQKTAHEGFQLWIKCMEKDPDAWARMRKYNMNDVALLERVYIKMRPWIKNHPNSNLYSDRPGCTRCGETKLQARGLARTTNGVYQRYQCTGCGAWMQGEKKLGKAKYKGVSA